MTWSPFNRPEGDDLKSSLNRVCAVCGETIVKGASMVPMKSLPLSRGRAVTGVYSKAGGGVSSNKTYRHKACQST